MDIEELLAGVNRHPTAQLLIRRTAELFDQKAPWEITAQDVLDYALVSKGSLYHHFKDFDELMLQALMYATGSRFTASLQKFEFIVELHADPILARENFRKAIEENQKSETESLRERRAYLVSLGRKHKTNTELLARFQDWKNERWIKVHSICKEKGWTEPNLDSLSVALMIQAMVVGRVVADSSGVTPANEIYDEVFWKVFERLFFSTYQESESMVTENH